MSIISLMNDGRAWCEEAIISMPYISLLGHSQKRTQSRGTVTGEDV